MVAIVAKMVAREITAAELPIISVVVILEMINQKTYPEHIVIRVSTNKYAAPLPTFTLLNFLHLS